MEEPFFLTREPASRVISFPDTPLSCGVRSDGEYICGNPATSGTATRQANGEWSLLPVCKQCSQALLAVYEK